MFLCELKLQPRWLRDKLWDYLLEDCLVFGLSSTKIGMRKWYNPWRWIRGPVYFKRVTPDEFWRCR
jgi:hypothetical protein